MAIKKKSYRQISNDMLAQITGGETSEEIAYTKGKQAYALSNSPVSRIDAVEDASAKAKKYRANIDFRLAGGNYLEWLPGGKHPEGGGIFRVRYTFSRQPLITDTNTGSVARTITEAFSKELEQLYEQLDAAYHAAFLNTAAGDALDLTVSVLGVRRKPPQPSSGIVTFGRNSDPEKVNVSGEVHLYDGSQEFELNKGLVREIESIDGTSGGADVSFKKDADFILSGRRVRWLPNAKKPEPRTVVRVNYVAYQEIIIPRGTKVATFSNIPEETRIFTTSDEASLRQSQSGKWEADISVTCAVPGRWGNVLAGTIAIMPKPVMGVEYVINKADYTNGVEAESDDELRERARHSLEFAAKATNASLQSALSSVEGVSSLLIDDMPDGVPGIVRAIVDGGSSEEILKKIDETRAAGIKVEFSRPRTVYIDASMTIVLQDEATAVQVAKQVESKIRAYISSLGIADDVLFARVVEAALSVGGVWDLSDMKIIAYREGAENIVSERGNIEVGVEERASPKIINITFRMRGKHE